MPDLLTPRSQCIRTPPSLLVARSHISSTLPVHPLKFLALQHPIQRDSLGRIHGFLGLCTVKNGYRLSHPQPDVTNQGELGVHGTVDHRRMLEKKTSRWGRKKRSPFLQCMSTMV
jgi:hypothetical protein